MVPIRRILRPQQHVVVAVSQFKIAAVVVDGATKRFGTKLMVSKDSPITQAQDLKGKRVIVTKGTTNEQALLHTIDSRYSLGLTFIVGDDHEQSFQMLVDGKGDAFATDDVLLYGLIARHKAKDRFRVVGDYLSYDPYGIMLTGGPKLGRQ